MEEKNKKTVSFIDSDKYNLIELKRKYNHHIRNFETLTIDMKCEIKTMSQEKLVYLIFLYDEVVERLANIINNDF